MRSLRILVMAGLVLVGGAACSGEAGVELEGSTSAEVDVSGDEVCQGAVEDLAGAADGVAESLSGDVDSFGDVVAGLEGFVDAAPEQIRADVRLLFDGYSTYLELWLESGIDTLFGDGEESEDAAALREAGAALRTPEMDAARDRVGDWLRTHCTDETEGAPADSVPG